MKSGKSSGLILAPLAIAITVAAVVLGVELLFMVLLHEVFIPVLPFKLSDTAWGVIDAVVLTVFVTPVLYFLVFQKMRDSEARFRLINASAQDAIIIINQSGEITEWNQAAQRMFQYSREEAIGRQLHKLLVPPRLHADVMYGFARFQQCGEGAMIGKTTEISALRKDGSEFPIELSISVFKESGNWYAVGISRDITGRKQAEDALREREQYLQEAQQVGRVGSYVYNIQEDTWTSSPMLDTIFGIDANYSRTVAGWLKIVHPSQRDEMRTYLNDIIARHRSFETEFRIVRPNDSAERWVMGLGKVEYQADGAPLRLIGTIQDITGRKQAEKEMAASLSLLTATMEATSDAILVVDLNNTWVLHNRKFVEMWHITDEIIASRDDGAALLYVLNQLEDAEGFLNKVRELYAMPETTSFDIITFKDGRIIERYSGPQIVNGVVMGRVWSFRDVTERKQIEATQLFLSESGYSQPDENFFQLLAKFLVNTLEMDFVCIDRLEGDGLTAQTVAVYCEGKFEDNISYALKDTPCGDVVARKTCCFTHDVRHLFPRDDMLQAMPAESYVGITLFNLDGAPIGLIALIGYKPLSNQRLAETVLQMVSVRAAAELERQQTEKMLNQMLSESNRARQAMLSVVEDQKRSEDALSRLNDELEHKVLMRTADLEQARLAADQASRAKSEFLATVSHEIRTPMNGVIGMIDALLLSSLDEQQKEMAKIIHDSAFSLLEIVNDILDFSKIEAGKLQVDAIVMDVSDVVVRACESLDHMALKKGVELTLFTDPAIPARVLGDSGRLRQILINLANNAIKFSSDLPQPGKVSVRAMLVEMSASQAVLEFHVTDNGIGIDEATQARLFTAFTQADSSTTRKFGGTGLGLAISSQLAILMGGEIRLQSEPGKGSTFSVFLTFALPPEQPVVNDVLYQVAGLSCLVVGGAQDLADDLSAYLAYDGAVVARAENMATVRQWVSSCSSGLHIIVFDAADTMLPLNELRSAAHARENIDIRFVVIGRGGRRQCRREAADIVALDAASMHRRVFLEAVSIAAGQAEVQSYEALANNAQAMIGLPVREKASRQRNQILIAEDNETNQKVILRQLALIGQTADIAANGREALELWQSGDYCLLLTDLNMPEMDGYELIAAIRAAESGKRMPIVAFSANALKCDEENCYSEGIDDCLNKPVQLANLKAMLEKWLPVSGEAETDYSQNTQDFAWQKLSSPPVTETVLPVDVNVLKALVGDEAAVINEFLHDFRVTAEKMAIELRSACAAGQATQAGAIAHKLKSSSRSVGALALGELCAEMEQAGKAGNAEALTLLLPGFELELTSVEQYLDGYQA